MHHILKNWLKVLGTFFPNQISIAICYIWVMINIGNSKNNSRYFKSYVRLFRKNPILYHKFSLLLNVKKRIEFKYQCLTKLVSVDKFETMVRPRIRPKDHARTIGTYTYLK